MDNNYRSLASCMKHGKNKQHPSNGRNYYGKNLSLLFYETLQNLDS